MIALVSGPQCHAAVEETGLQAPVKKAEGHERRVFFALAADHRIKVAVLRGELASLPIVEDMVMGGRRIGLPPDHPIIGTALVAEVL